MSIPQDDAFAGGTKRESLSFKGAPIGTSYSGTVLEEARLVQSRNFDTGEPDFWPLSDADRAAGKQPNPKMSAVFPIVLPDGEERSVWAPKPSAMFSAVAGAQRDLGRALRPGDKVTITFTREEVNPDPVKAKRLNPKKIYEVKIAAGDAFAGGDTPDL